MYQCLEFWTSRLSDSSLMVRCCPILSAGTESQLWTCAKGEGEAFLFAVNCDGAMQCICCFPNFIFFFLSGTNSLESWVGLCPADNFFFIWRNGVGICYQAVFVVAEKLLVGEFAEVVYEIGSCCVVKGASSGSSCCLCY